MFSLSAKSNLRKTTTNQVPPRLSLSLSGAYASPPQQPPRLGNDGPELAAGRGEATFHPTPAARPSFGFFFIPSPTPLWDPPGDHGDRS